METGLLHLRVPRYDFAAAIALEAAAAPNAVGSLLEVLPVAGLVTAESRYGSVVCLRLPDFSACLQGEEKPGLPEPGDVFLFAAEHGVELVAYYREEGVMGVPFNARGELQGTRVGHLAAAAARQSAARVWSEGAAWGVLERAAAAASRGIVGATAAAAAEIEARRQLWARRTRADHVGAAPRTGRRLRLCMPQYEARCKVELLEEMAPHSCSRIWDNLPLEVELVHARYSGPEVFPQGVGWQWDAHSENQTAHPIPGDMMLYIGPPPRAQFAYFYDRDAVPMGGTRPEAGNRVGRSVGDFHDFATGCWGTAYEGAKNLVIERAG